MYYPQSFRNLIDRLNILENRDKNLNFIGFGNPNAQILIIGKEASIGDNSEQQEYEIKDNLNQWTGNILDFIQSEDVEDWFKCNCDKDKFNPLFPYKGQLNKRDNGKNKGTSPTWCSYQKLIDAVYEKHTRNNAPIDIFHDVFITDLSTKVSSQSPLKNNETAASIEIRCKELFCYDFFKEFPIIIVACGHYKRMYDIDLEKIFDQQYTETITKPYGNRKGWYNIHKNKNGQILIHTRQLSNRLSNGYIQDIANEIRKYL